MPEIDNAAVPQTETVARVASSTLMADPSHDQDQASSEGVLGVLKGLHPATVHFPIALFLMAAMTELFVAARRTSEREAAVRIMLYGAAASAIVASLFGWIHTGIWFGGDSVMQLHRWIGMTVAVLGIAAVWIAHREVSSRTMLRTLLFTIALLIGVQGFLGGELAHGVNHLNL
jgi:uncharacterized membrane protein